MRQLITRLPDDLHQRLKARAQARGQSVNEYVVDALTASLGEPRSPAATRELLQRRGLLFTPPAPSDAPSQEEIARLYAGSGTAVSDALAAERAAR